MISLILSGVWALLVSVASWVGQIVPGMPALLPAPAAIEQQAPDNLAKKAFAATLTSSAHTPLKIKLIISSPYI